MIRKAKRSLSISRHVAERERIGQGTATVERIRKAGESFELSPAGHQRINDTIDDLLKQRKIDDREWHAGDTFRANAWIAKVEPNPTTVNWDAVGGNFGPRVPIVFTAQRIASARLEHRKAREALGFHSYADRIAEYVLIQEYPLVVVGRLIWGRGDRRDARASALDTLKMTLNQLANHYERGTRR